MTTRRGRVELATARDLRLLPPEQRTGTLAVAALALALAKRLDDPEITDRDAATVARELRYIIAALPRQATKQKDQVDEIRAKREARRGA